MRSVTPHCATRLVPTFCPRYTWLFEVPSLSPPLPDALSPLRVSSQLPVDNRFTPQTRADEFRTHPVVGCGRVDWRLPSELSRPSLRQRHGHAGMREFGPSKIEFGVRRRRYITRHESQPQAPHSWHVLLPCCEGDLLLAKASGIPSDLQAPHEGGGSQPLAGLRHLFLLCPVAPAPVAEHGQTGTQRR